MSKYKDGCYDTDTGIALIAKVLASQGTMNYTRAAVGKGNLTDDQDPKTMEEPADYVMDAKITAVTAPVDGECQITVQISSKDVSEGFYCTGIVVYAEDPDDGEVPYTYMVLENEPEWIRPSSEIVGKLATFDIIAAVGKVDKVTAVIDPMGIPTVENVKGMIDSHNEDKSAHPDLQDHVKNNENPHNVTKEQVGLGNVDNTADKDKNVASAKKLTTPQKINGVAFDGADPITVYDDTKATDIGIVSDCNQAFNNRRPANLTWWQWNRDTVNSPKSSGLTTYIAGVGYTYYSGSEWGVQVAWDGRGSAFYRARLNNNDWEPWRRQGLDAYPVGSYYWSSEPTSPASLFGGTWTQIEGRFILTAGGGYAAGSTGGAASVTSGGTALTESQIPPHDHEEYVFTTADPSSMSAVTLAVTGYANVNGAKSGMGYTGNAGGGQPHAHTVATMPPYIVAYCWRRVA